MIERPEATTGDSDIVRRERLLVDLDPIRPSGISSSDEEHGAALDRAKRIAETLRDDYGWPEPMVLADSGNGAHLIFAIDLPNDAANTKLIERVLGALDFRFSDTRVGVDVKVGNASRITKLYGTKVMKGDDTPERPHRVSHVIREAARVIVAREQLETLAAGFPESPVMVRTQGTSSFDLPDWLVQHSVPVGPAEPWQGGTKYIFERCPWDDNHRHSAFIVHFPNGAIAAGCHHNSCQRYSWREIRERYEPGAYDRRAIETPARRDFSKPDEARYAPNRSPDVETEVSEPAVVIDAVDLLRREYTAPRFLIDLLIEDPSLILFTGDTGAAKTAFMLHMAGAIAAGCDVAERFTVDPAAGPVLYLNGEMSRNTMQRFVQQAAAGLPQGIPPGRLFFEGDEAVAQFRFGDAQQRDAIERRIAMLRPSIVFIDTVRALLEIEENETPEVRRAFGWLRGLMNRYRCSIMNGHHLRKLSPVSNSDRERVAGSRDLIAVVDIHLVAKAISSRPLHALQIGKTRASTAEVSQGTEWPIEARLEFGPDGEPPKSRFIAGEPRRGDTSEAGLEKVEQAKDELRSRLEADGPMTREEMGVDKGSKKRAYEALKHDGELVEVGKDGRKTLYGLSALQEPDDLSPAARSRPDHTRDHARGKALQRKGLSVVTARPRSDRAGQPRLDGGQRVLALTPSSVPPTEGVGDERGQRSAIYSDHDHDHAREADDEYPPPPDESEEIWEPE